MRKIGRVTELLKNIREKEHHLLTERFKRIIGVKAIKEYLAAKIDTDLNVECNLVEEEILRRMSSSSPYLVVRKIDDSSGDSN